MEHEQKSDYICTVCHKKARLGFYEAQRLGWYWERRVGILYDYYCPSCAKKNNQEKKHESDGKVLAQRHG